MDDPGAAALDDARDAHARRDWPTARAAFHTARDAGTELSAEDLEALSDCAWWLGLGDESVEVGDQAYRAFLRDGQPRRAAISAVGVAVVHLMRGDETLGTAWAGRAQRLLADEPECAEHGYLLYGEVEDALVRSELDAVLTGARQLQEIGRRHDDAALVALGTLAEGQALVRQGRVRDGMALLDESMLAALSDELPPAFTGNIYCHLVAACWELADLRRARDWTSAFERWLARLPAAVVFNGICQVHRAQLLQLTGDWQRAERQTEQACDVVAGMHVAPAAEGWYTAGDIRRLRGDLAGAETAYAHAHRLGRDPQPGRALLLLAQGRAGPAAVSIRAVLAGEQRGPLQRVPLLVAQVDIAQARCPRCGGRAACGPSWTRPTRWRAHACCWRAPTRHSATRTRRRWSWTRPRRHSSGSVPHRRPPRYRGSAAARPSPAG